MRSTLKGTSLHCQICDKEDNSISYDRVTGEFTPCLECQEAIQECLAEFDNLEEEPPY